MGSDEHFSSFGTGEPRACATSKKSEKKVTQGIQPNWRKAKEYPKSKDLDLLHWRWEFLRRSQEYQRDWDRLSRQEATDIHTWKPKVLQEDLKSVLQKYGLKTVLPNPSHQDPPYLQFQHLAEQVHIGGVRQKGGFSNIQVPPTQGAVLFDLTKPIPPQLTLAKTALHGAQELLTGEKQGRRKHPSHWPLLLRILDARAQRVTYSEIGQLLLGLVYYNEAAARAKQLHTEALHLSRNFPF